MSEPEQAREARERGGLRSDLLDDPCFELADRKQPLRAEEGETLEEDDRKPGQVDQAEEPQDQEP